MLIAVNERAVAMVAQRAFSEPAIPERFSSPDQQSHDVKRKKYEPCDRKHHKQRRISAISLKTGTEQPGIGKRCR